MRAPGPEVRAWGEGEDTVVEVLPGSGEGLLSLVVEGARLRATDPPIRRLDGPRVVLRNPAAIGGHRHVTDVYLLGLATTRNARLSTFERSTPLTAVVAASRANLGLACGAH